LKSLEFQSLILYELLHPYGFNAADVENILKSLKATSGKQFFSNTHVLIKDRNCLIIEKRDKIKEEIMIIHNIDDLENHGFVMEKFSHNGSFHPVVAPNVIYVDAAKLTFPLTIRSWQKGDFFYPFGMKTKKKLSDFFTDLKIDLLEKQKIRLLCSQDQIVWIINHRADNRFRVDGSTEGYYRIEVRSQKSEDRM
jgi:tRNA(Ile)-lysidine synthase